MNRITPEQVLKAYEQRGLKPMQDQWYEKAGQDRCGCALTAVILSQHPELEDLEEEESLNEHIDSCHGALLDSLDNDYISGFIGGFDQGKIPTINARPVYLDGHNDGKAVWEAVKHLANQETSVS